MKQQESPQFKEEICRQVSVDIYWPTDIMFALKILTLAVQHKTQKKTASITVINSQPAVRGPTADKVIEFENKIAVKVFFFLL